MRRMIDGAVCNIPTLGKWSTRPSEGGWGTDELDDESSAMDPKIKSWVFGYTVILYSVYVPISYFYD